MFQYSLF